MTSRVTLVSPAITPSLRRARFDDGDSIEAEGAARARAAAGALPAAVRVVASPSVRCRETASALGLDASAEPDLAGLDMGRWRGRTLDEVGAAEPEAVARWLADPGAAAHGGESVRQLCARVVRWLDAERLGDGRTLAVVEPEVVRAVVVQVLGAPEAAFWRVDVPPLTATEVTGRSGRWNLRLGHALASSGDVPVH
ncbi:phosphoglycerate mutase [Streptomyces cellostaticus]|uniref:Phosphoglycerate mutase n=1 Tax=Streptomyces cellostaticus TaxID=67285 RepID=A0A101NHI3_9ACTN|nr:histidine phosphatase family protein [Streptomyces cellostaticus]KUM93403.1 phosphoglycerate mutase [Streptomyces cellostaticus]GHI02248.1 phosphoglycerate mutase [Streptomyces cellostaticus]